MYSDKLGIILIGPQGCGKTYFLRGLLKNNKVAQVSENISKKELLDLYVLDAIVIEDISTLKKLPKDIKDFPLTNTLRPKYSVESKTFLRPLIIAVSTAVPQKEAIKLKNWVTISINPSDPEWKIELRERIFQFIISKHK